MRIDGQSSKGFGSKIGFFKKNLQELRGCILGTPLAYFKMSSAANEFKFCLRRPYWQTVGFILLECWKWLKQMCIESYFFQSGSMLSSWVWRFGSLLFISHGLVSIPLSEGVLTNHGQLFYGFSSTTTLSLRSEYRTLNATMALCWCKMIISH